MHCESSQLRIPLNPTVISLWFEPSASSSTKKQLQIPEHPSPKDGCNTENCSIQSSNFFGFLGIFLQDGHFVPNLTIGAPVIESLRKQTKAFLDCHLMVTNPIDYVEPLGKAGASGFTFHVEVSKENWQELIQKIKSKAMRPGVALKPGTPIEEVYPLVDSENLVEMVLVMTVEPGFGGQKFMPEMVDKVRVLRKKYPALDIEVDGGLGPSTIEMAASAGANCIVAGSSIFGAAEPGTVIFHMRSCVLENQEKC
ncbi:ribulose-phosphate 3-epimerase, cytoplasmic isoform [Gossypium hirsutum]|uniref:Ribulose-phosphate 3-epimerase, cytoplasmic isoform n=1 Tax=Gossypium hirsutum TaxID=3635 RepID=A0ABM2YVI1_GOSHI|nr:ribulose-phosphate 3-epimerase, cytoplasmic isoform-like [Gossypium hirsutum]